VIRPVTREMVAVGGHYLEIGHEGEIATSWRLLCGACLVPRASQALPRTGGSGRGLPPEGAIHLPALDGWPALTLAWGVVREHPEERAHHPRQLPIPRRRPTVRFRQRWGWSCRADPILVSGGLWLAAAPGCGSCQVK